VTKAARTDHDDPGAALSGPSPQGRERHLGTDAARVPECDAEGRDSQA
jgi:hypothetical protein